MLPLCPPPAKRVLERKCAPPTTRVSASVNASVSKQALSVKAKSDSNIAEYGSAASKSEVTNDRGRTPFRDARESRPRAAAHPASASQAAAIAPSWPSPKLL